MERLKIAFDAKRAVCNNTGLGNYSRLVIDVLSRIYPQNEYLLYSPVKRKNDRLAPLSVRDNVHLQYPDSWAGHTFSSLWRVNGITQQLRKNDVTLFHGLSNELPLNISKHGIPSVVTIHDLIFRHYPEYYKPIDRHIYDYKFRHAATIANRIIAISECTRRDLIDIYGIAPEKIDVVYQGCDPIFSVLVSLDDKQMLQKQYSLPSQFIVAVGTVEARKNQLLAVKALRGLPDNVHLVIVGHRTSYAKTIDDYLSSHKLSSRVMFIDSMPFNFLPILYSMALFSSYTSRFEGFGLPIIESISMCTPVIAATGSCLEEAGGGGALYVHPDDADQYVDHALQIINDSDYRQHLVTEGQQYISRFSQERLATDIMTSYNKVLSGIPS